MTKNHSITINIVCIIILSFVVNSCEIGAKNTEEGFYNKGVVDYNYKFKVIENYPSKVDSVVRDRIASFCHDSTYIIQVSRGIKIPKDKSKKSTVDSTMFYIKTKACDKNIKLKLNEYFVIVVDNL